MIGSNITKPYSYDTTSQATLYSKARAELKKIDDTEVNYEVAFSSLPDNVEIGDRINIVDDAGELYVSARILKLETSICQEKQTATLGEYLIKDSGISQKVEDLAKQFSEIAKNRVLYTWIAYADDENGTGITVDPTGKAYMGTAVNQTVEEVDVTDPAVFKWAKIQGDPGEDGQPGPQGETGAKGADGKGIKSTAITYQVGVSGTTAPTGTWSTTIPAVSAGQYLWTKTVFTYTDDTESTVYSVGMMGATGSTGATGATGKGIKSTEITYQAGSSGTTAPTGTWSATIPALSAGQYLWTKTVWTYTDNTTSTAYSVGMKGETGSTGPQGEAGPQGEPGEPGVQGETGVGVASVATYYAVSNSSTSCAGANWLLTMPEIGVGEYLWVKTVTTYTDNTTGETEPALAEAITVTAQRWASWCSANDKTLIDGAKIYTGSITAEKIHVTDLYTLGATIGGFAITENSIYSGEKSYIDSTVNGLYMDTDGQFTVGSDSSYLKFYKNDNNVYSLDLSFNTDTIDDPDKNYFVDGVTTKPEYTPYVNADYEYTDENGNKYILAFSINEEYNLNIADPDGGIIGFSFYQNIPTDYYSTIYRKIMFSSDSVTDLEIGNEIEFSFFVSYIVANGDAKYIDDFDVFSPCLQETNKIISDRNLVRSYSPGYEEYWQKVTLQGVIKEDISGNAALFVIDIGTYSNERNYAHKGFCSNDGDQLYITLPKVRKINSGTEVSLNADGLKLGNFFSVSNLGELTATSGTFSGYITTHGETTYVDTFGTWHTYDGYVNIKDGLIESIGDYEKGDRTLIAAGAVNIYSEGTILSLTNGIGYIDQSCDYSYMFNITPTVDYYDGRSDGWQQYKIPYLSLRSFFYKIDEQLFYSTSEHVGTVLLSPDSFFMRNVDHDVSKKAMTTTIDADTGLCLMNENLGYSAGIEHTNYNISEGDKFRVFSRDSTGVSAIAPYGLYNQKNGESGWTPVATVSTGGHIRMGDVNGNKNLYMYFPHSGSGTGACTIVECIKSADNTSAHKSYMRPYGAGRHGEIALGSTARAWYRVYGTLAYVTTSDRREKDNIVDMDDKYLEMLYDLIPRTYYKKDDPKKVTHTGLIAQEVLEVMAKYNISEQDFGGFIHNDTNGDNEIDEDDLYSLGYEEFISILIKAVQEQNKRITELERRM